MLFARSSSNDAALRLDVSVVLGLSLLAGSLLPVAVGPAALAIAITLLLAQRRMGTWRVCLVVTAVALGALRTERAVRRYDARRAAVRDELGGPSRCHGVGAVVSSPVLLRSGRARSPPEGLVPSWEVELAEIDCEGRAIEPFRARIYGGPDDLGRGDVVEVIATLAPAQLFRNEGLSDPRPAAARKGIFASGGGEDVRIVRRGAGIGALIDRFRARCRRRIEATFAGDAAPMARALVLGESDLSEEDDAAFRASGLAHLLAVSGTHLVLVVAGAVHALAFLLVRIEKLSARWDVGRASAAFGAVFAWAYADFAGGSGSAVRAAAMLSVALAARAFGRGPHGVRAFGLSLAGAALVDPLVAFDMSFLLSVAATAGLMFLHRPLAARLSGATTGEEPLGPFKRARRAIAPALSTTLAATVGCAPLIAFIAPALPVGGVIANLLAVPLGELVALPLCLAHTLLGFVPAIERGDAAVASGGLLVVRAIARATERATWLALPVPQPTSWQCALLWCTAASSYFEVRRRRWSILFIGAALLCLTEGITRRQTMPIGKLRITVLDVAQGDASLIDLPDGRAILVDAGGLVGSPIDTGRAVVAPLLRARRRADLAAVVLSHPHPDHYGGMSTALRDVRVGEFWDTGQGEREGAGPAYDALLAALRARGIPVVRPDALCGAPRAFGEATIEILAPCPAPTPFVNANDNSFVLRVAYGRRAALLVGDAEREEEDWLLSHHASSLAADFLKVGHHGSATSSTPAFVAAVGAHVAAISCGVRNRFGHPNPVTLRTLAGRIHRTDRQGSIRWETDGADARVVDAAQTHALERLLLGDLIW